MQTILDFALLAQQHSRRPIFTGSTAGRTWNARLVPFVMQQSLRVITSRWINWIRPCWDGIFTLVVFALQTEPMHVFMKVILQPTNFIAQRTKRSQTHAVICIATRHCERGRRRLGRKQARSCRIDCRQPNLTAATAGNKSDQRQRQYSAPPDDGGTRLVICRGSGVSIHWSVAEFVGLGC